MKRTISPDQSMTDTLDFSIPAAGTFYLSGRNFGGWNFGEILAEYPNGSGYGLHLESPFMVVTGH